MLKTPRSVRPHIVLAGKRNSGKSSLINNLTGHDIAIVSDTPGTTTDPVSKAMELLPYGPVVFVDTAGLDDTGELGQKRIKKAEEAVKGADLILYVTRPDDFNEKELPFLKKYSEKTLFISTFASEDSAIENSSFTSFRKSSGIKIYEVSNITGAGIEELKADIISRLEKNEGNERSLLSGLTGKEDLVLMIIPIDLSAPKGRIILPQVQAIRDTLDKNAASLVVQESEIEWALSLLKNPPSLAITDSQAVLEASNKLPENIPLTTFSTVFSRWKGDLATYVKNVYKIDQLKDGDKVLVAETCSHQALCDDIARYKIPAWLEKHTGKKLDIEVFGGQFPDNVTDYDLIIHCGGCMITRQMMVSRTENAVDLDIPITNYGVAISYLQGVLDRVIEPFRAEIEAAESLILSGEV
jgi:[FeFe] hydrogenase H-cluster maturation GTPase HydF